MDLGDVLSTYRAVRLVGASKSGHKIHQIALTHFERFLKRKPTTGDLTDETVGSWLNWLLDDRNLQRPTVAMYRARLLALWRFANHRHWVSTWPEIPAIRRPKRVNPTFTLNQLRTLWAATYKLQHHIGGIPAGGWFRALVSFVWATGARRGECLKLERANIDLDRGTAFVRAESRKGQDTDRLYQLSPLCVSAFREIWLPERRCLLPFPYVSEMYSAQWRRLLAIAGLSQSRHWMTHAIRRAFGSYLKLMGGDPTEALGHSDPSVTRDSYIDPSICPPDVPWKRLPGLDGTDDGPRAA